MAPRLPAGTRFELGPGKKKYTAIIPQKGGRDKRVSFGHKDYEHFKDSVPKSLGGGKWSHKDHGDKARRSSYRSRHGALKCKDGKRCIEKKYSPAWFSYYFLW